METLNTSGIRCLIVCHSGQDAGLGHLTRSLFIAKALKKKITEDLTIIIHGDKINRSDLNNFNHFYCETSEEFSLLIINLVNSKNINLIFFDLHLPLIYSNFENLLLELKKKQIKIISIDSLYNYSKHLDLIFVPSFQKPVLDNAKYSNLIYGWDCLLLNVNKTPKKWVKGSKILILTGGSDAANLGEIFPEKLCSNINKHSVINWVVGPYSQKPNLQGTKNPNITFRTHTQQINLDNLICNTNYAITVYGVSFFELLYYGIPTVVFSPYGEKDRTDLEIIKKENLAMVAKDESEAILLLNQLMNKDAEALRLSSNARKKLSKLGDTNLINCVKNMFV